jgi:hypothetical protein
MPDHAKEVGLPPRVFLYTLDQISVLISVPMTRLRAAYIYFEQRSIGHKDTFQMSARNIAPTDEKPDWRVSEKEFVRWMRVMGYKYYDRGWAE